MRVSTNKVDIKSSKFNEAVLITNSKTSITSSEFKNNLHLKESNSTISKSNLNNILVYLSNLILLPENLSLKDTISIGTNSSVKCGKKLWTNDKLKPKIITSENLP